MKVLNNGGWNKKRGVALVTVLLMMMVATIATTAIYKWLSRMGDSSSAEPPAARSDVLLGTELAADERKGWRRQAQDPVGTRL